jgi:hypothetical protein
MAELVTPELVARPAPTARHPRCHDAQDARRRVRTLIGHLPADRRDRTTWRHVIAELAKAAGGSDPADASIALRMVLSIEGVEYRRP